MGEGVERERTSAKFWASKRLCRYCQHGASRYHVKNEPYSSLLVEIILPGIGIFGFEWSFKSGVEVYYGGRVEAQLRWMNVSENHVASMHVNSRSGTQIVHPQSPGMQRSGFRDHLSKPFSMLLPRHGNSGRTCCVSSKHQSYPNTTGHIYRRTGMAHT